MGWAGCGYFGDFVCVFQAVSEMRDTRYSTLGAGWGEKAAEAGNRKPETGRGAGNKEKGEMEKELETESRRPVKQMK